jgi:hypothetical protein
MRVCRLRAMQSQKAMKEIVWRAKRLTREMQAYWKRYDRVEKVYNRFRYKFFSNTTFIIELQILIYVCFRSKDDKQKKKQRNNANSM